MKKALLYALIFVIIHEVCTLLTDVAYLILFCRYDVLQAVRAVNDNDMLWGSLEMFLSAGVACAVCSFIFIRLGWCSKLLFRFPLPQATVIHHPSPTTHHPSPITPPPFSRSETAIAAAPEKSVEGSVGVLLLAAAAAAAMLLPSIGLQELLPQLPDLTENAPIEIDDPMLTLLSVALFAPIMEEVVFRGAILNMLLRRTYGTVWPVFFSALLFAIVHINPAQMPHAFIMGLILAYIFAQTRSLLPCIVCHCTNNFLAMLLPSFIYDIDEANFTDLFHGNAAAIALAVAMSLTVFMLAMIAMKRLYRRQ